MTRDLEPLEPEEAVELHLAQQKKELAERTVKAHWYRLKHFLRWCDEEAELDNMNNLSGRGLHKFRLWRQEDGDLNTVSIRTQLMTLRVFIEFCESIDGVEDGLHDKIIMPTVGDDEGVRDDMLKPERAGKVLDHLRRFDYASRKHVITLLLWRTSMRLGALHSLDVEDFDEETESLAVEHRPTRGTSLKNKSSGERIVSLTKETCVVLADWIEHNRPNVPDEHGRDPLITTQHGRVSQSNIRELVYHVTRPCEYGGDCHCPEKHNYETASLCEHSRSPHCLRRGSLTHLLRNDVPKAVVSDRGDVSPDVLDEHYNQMTEEEKMEQRRGYLEDL